MGKGLTGLWMIVLAVTVSACAAPQFTYVSNSADRTYFKVPGGWHHLSDTAVASAFGSGGSGQQTGVWVVGSRASARRKVSLRMARIFACRLVAAGEELP